MDIAELQKECFENSAAHGFWEGENDDIYRKIALIHSEASEALEVIRDGHDPQEVWWDHTRKNEEGMSKPEGFPMELADIIVRVLDLAGRYQINMEIALDIKGEYNQGREHMHGKPA